MRFTSFKRTRQKRRAAELEYRWATEGRTMIASLLLTYLFAVAAPSPLVPQGAAPTPRVARFAAVPYPEAARRARIVGTVLVSVAIGPDGVVNSQELLQNLPMGLSEKCFKAAKSWGFNRSASRERHATLEFVFQLDRPNAPATGFNEVKPPRSVAQPVIPAGAPKAARRRTPSRWASGRNSL